MFVGHLAAALVAKRAEPKVSLGTWVLAALLADLMTFPLLIAGIEHFDTQPSVTTNPILGRDIVFSHSLLMLTVYGALVATLYFLYRRYPRGALLLGLVVISHWLLDVASHGPDMPLAPGVALRLGLGLWNSVPATLLVEGGLWCAAIVLYLRATRARGRTALFGFWAGVLLLTLLWLGNLNKGMNPDPVKAGVGGLIVFSLICLWAYWVNRLRSAPQSSTKE